MRIKTVGSTFSLDGDLGLFRPWCPSDPSCFRRNSGGGGGGGGGGRGGGGSGPDGSSYDWMRTRASIPVDAFGVCVRERRERSTNMYVPLVPMEIFEREVVGVATGCSSTGLRR